MYAIQLIPSIRTSIIAIVARAVETAFKPGFFAIYVSP
jgi:hypothetical protein